jgi:hypothetical protein
MHELNFSFEFRPMNALVGGVILPPSSLKKLNFFLGILGVAITEGAFDPQANHWMLRLTLGENGIDAAIPDNEARDPVKAADEKSIAGLAFQLYITLAQAEANRKLTAAFIGEEEQMAEQPALEPKPKSSVLVMP